MENLRKFAKQAISLCLVLSMFLGLSLSCSVRAYATEKSIGDVITEAVGTTGNIKSKKKEYVIDRFALNEAMVDKTSAGWNDSKGTAVVVVQCKKKSQAKKVVKKFNSYLKNCKTDAARYGGSASDYLKAAQTGTTGKFALLVMLSKKSDDNKKGIKAAKERLGK